MDPYRCSQQFIFSRSDSVNNLSSLARGVTNIKAEITKKVMVFWQATYFFLKYVNSPEKKSDQQFIITIQQFTEDSLALCMFF